MLLILAGVSIATLTGSNGIFNRVNDAKIETALGAVKEALKLEQGEKVIDNKNLTPEILLSEGKVSRTVQAGENSTYYMYYAIKENAYEGMQGLGKGNIASLKDVFLIDDNLNVKYISGNGKEYGDNLDNKVLGDETEIRFASKAFSEYISKISGVTEDEMKFKWMKNQTELKITDPSVDSLQDLVFFPNLTSLRLETLNLENLDGIENCVKLTSFFTFGTKIKDHMKLSILPILKQVYIASDVDFNNIIESLKLVETLRSFTMMAANDVKTTKRVSELNNGLESLTLRLNNIEKIEGLENKTNLRDLDLKNNKIQKIEGLENKTNLRDLDLKNNKIQKIEGLENCTNLKYLYLDSNKITKIENIEMLKDLNELFLSSNQLTDILNADKNDKLTYLNLLNNPNIKSNRNEYTEDENKRLDKIQEILTVRDGKIDIDADQLRLFSGYKTINLSSSDISTLEVLEGQTELEHLSLWACTNITLTDIKSQEILKSMKKLKTLNLSRTNVKDLTAINELKNLIKLTIDTKNNLDLSQMEDVISQVRIEGVIKQEDINSILKCDNQKITKLSFGGQITMLPDISVFPNLNTLILVGHQKISNFDIVSKCTNLVELNLINTNLHERMIDFSKLTKLTKLDLSNNALWSEDLEYLKVLKNNKNLSIDLKDNSIIDASALLELDESCYIDLRNNKNLSQESKDKLRLKFQNKLYI